MRALLVTVAAALLGACGLLDEEAYVRYPGALEYFTQPALVSVPDSARVGESFTVNVTTYGTDCSERDRTQISQSGMVGYVTPYDINRHGTGRNCGEGMRTHQHTASFRFDQAGTATINVFGIRLPAQEQMALQRTVVIH